MYDKYSCIFYIVSISAFESMNVYATLRVYLYRYNNFSTSFGGEIFSAF